ncbi:c-type cytochrome [Thermopetrobacter sp. TC1]|uniref:c-type cytochrome n=1 Tax=Thermopetrobacter sp. TC1 TaxID=1495045 RepID=UPI001E400788|nr:c-type cytochrome [Thermopetrobacter sp. TC1]
MKLSPSTLVALIGIGAIGIVWWTGRGSTPGEATSLLRPDDAAIVARGEKVYAQYCASCHGRNLEGQPGWQQGAGKAPPHDASGHTWHHPDTLLFRITREGTAKLTGGRGSMPGFGGVLTDDDIIAVLSFIKSRWPDRIRAAHDAVNARAARGS